MQPAEIVMNDAPSISAILDTLYAKWQRRKWIAILCFSSAAAVALSLIIALPSLYRASTTILFGEDVMAESLIKVATSNELDQRLGVVRQSVMSRSQLQQVIDKFNLYPNLSGRVPAEALINRLRKDITIDQRASSQVEWGRSSVYAITISYQTWDPELAAAVANDIAARFKAENELLKMGQTERASEFIRKELEAARAKFAAQEARINEYKASHMGQLPEQQQLNLATLERLNAELRLNGEKQVQLFARRDSLLLGAATGTGTENVVGLSSSLRLDRLKRELAELQTRYTSNHPNIIRLQTEIRDLEAERQRTAVPLSELEEPKDQPVRPNPADIDSELAVLRQQEQRLRADIATLLHRIETAPQIEAELKSFAADYDAAREEYLALQRMYQDTRLAESLGVEQSQEFRVLEAAIPPDTPRAPQRSRLMLVALFLAGGFGVGMAFLVELIDSSFHSRSEISSFTRVPVIATVGAIRTSGERWGKAVRFVLVGILAGIGIVILSYLSFRYGQNAQQLVWTLAG